MPKPKLVIRLDDIHPWMDLQKFERFCSGVLALGGVGLLGVIPHCKDPALRTGSAPDPGFWSAMRRLKSDGWVIAQHGYTHVYDRVGKTYLGVISPGEFVGHSTVEQERRLLAGRRIMDEEGLSTEVFMAPKHAFDAATFVALKSSGFRYITDGYGFWPYDHEGIRLIPQLLSGAHGLPLGVYTTCFHLDMLSESAIDRAVAKLSAFEVVSFHEASAIRAHPLLQRAMLTATSLVLRPRRALKLRQARL